MSRLRFSRGIRASQLTEKYAGDPSEPWLSDMPEPAPMTRRQEIALLTLRHAGRAGHADQVLRALYARGERPAMRSDYESLVGLQLATRNKQGTHDITPIGHWRAGKVAHAVAAELGLKLVDYSRPRRYGPQPVLGMSGGGNA